MLLERKTSLRVLKEFVTGLKAAAAETSSRDLLVRGFATKDWESAYAFMSEHLDKVAEEQQRIDQEYGDLSRTADATRARLAESASKRAPQRYEASIVVDSKEGGRARVSVTYLVSGASWEPLYDARLDPGRETVTIEGLGRLTQSTGED